MPFLIPLLFTGATAGAWWWTSSKTEESTFSSELFNILKPILIIIIGVLLLRWLYQKGTSQNQKK